MRDCGNQSCVFVHVFTFFCLHSFFFRVRFAVIEKTKEIVKTYEKLAHVQTITEKKQQKNHETEKCQRNFGNTLCFIRIDTITREKKNEM